MLCRIVVHLKIKYDLASVQMARTKQHLKSGGDVDIVNQVLKLRAWF